MIESNFFDKTFVGSPNVPRKVSSRTLRSAIEEALTDYIRRNLETVLGEELRLPWTNPDRQPSDDNYTKRDVV